MAKREDGEWEYIQQELPNGHRTVIRKKTLHPKPSAPQRGTKQNDQWTYTYTVLPSGQAGVIKQDQRKATTVLINDEARIEALIAQKKVAVPPSHKKKHTLTATRDKLGDFWLRLILNGFGVRCMIDTGATSLVLCGKDAKTIGINVDELEFNRRSSTAAGEVMQASVTLDTIQAGPFVDTNFDARVNNSGLEETLIGMSYLKLFDLIVQDDQMRLIRTA